MALEITIDQTEIETAIKKHIGTLFTVADGQNININLKAGRGENGFSATIEIGAAKSESTPTQQAPVERLNGKVVSSQATAETTQAEAEPATDTGKAAAKLFGAATVGRNITASADAAAASQQAE